MLAVLAIASYRLLFRRGEELIRREALGEATAGADAARAGALAAVAALVAAGAAPAWPADDLEALRSLLEDVGPQLVRSGRQTGARVKAQTPSADRAVRRIAAAAIVSQRRLLLDLRARVLALQIQDPRAENARRLAAESLALFAACLGRVQAASGVAPKAAQKQLAQARQLLEEAIYRGSRAGFLLKP